MRPSHAGPVRDYNVFPAVSPESGRLMRMAGFGGKAMSQRQRQRQQSPPPNRLERSVFNACVRKRALGLDTDTQTHTRDCDILGNSRVEAS
jgi:hypothetical protein